MGERCDLENLMKQRFLAHEHLTLVTDLFVPGDTRGETGWLNVLKGNQNFNIVIQDVYINSLRDAPRNQLLESAYNSNQNIGSIKLSGLAFSDWQEVRKTLTS